MKRLIKKNNLLIAKFMGCVFVNDAPDVYPNGYYIDEESNYPSQISDMEFHCSWDWIMPVVHKCTLLIVDGRPLGDSLEELHAKKIYTMHLNNSLNSVWLSVIEFIEWYNKNERKQRR